MATITLVRHAKVSLDSSWIYPHELKSFIVQYDYADIESFKVDKNLSKVIASSTIFITSTLKRSKETLKRLKKEATLSSELFNEASLPYPKQKVPIKLPASLYIVLFRVAWFFGYSNNAKSFKQEQKRAKEAAKMLVEYQENLLLIGHGIFNTLLEKELKKLGAKKVYKRASKANLGVTCYTI